MNDNDIEVLPASPRPCQGQQHRDIFELPIDLRSAVENGCLKNTVIYLTRKCDEVLFTEELFNNYSVALDSAVSAFMNHVDQQNKKLDSFSALQAQQVQTLELLEKQQVSFQPGYEAFMDFHRDHVKFLGMKMEIKYKTHDHQKRMEAYKTVLEGFVEKAPMMDSIAFVLSAKFAVQYLDANNATDQVKLWVQEKLRSTQLCPTSEDFKKIHLEFIAVQIKFLRKTLSVQEQRSDTHKVTKKPAGIDWLSGKNFRKKIGDEGNAADQDARKKLIEDMKMTLEHRLKLTREFEYVEEHFDCLILAIKISFMINDVDYDIIMEQINEVFDLCSRKSGRFGEILPIAAGVLSQSSPYDLYEHPIYGGLKKFFTCRNIKHVTPIWKDNFIDLLEKWKNIPTPNEMNPQFEMGNEAQNIPDESCAENQVNEESTLRLLTNIKINLSHIGSPQYAIEFLVHNNANVIFTEENFNKFTVELQILLDFYIGIINEKMRRRTENEESLSEIGSQLSTAIQNLKNYAMRISPGCENFKNWHDSYLSFFEMNLRQIMETPDAARLENYEEEVELFLEKNVMPSSVAYILVATHVINYLKKNGQTSRAITWIEEKLQSLEIFCQVKSEDSKRCLWKLLVICDEVQERKWAEKAELEAKNDETPDYAHMLNDMCLTRRMLYKEDYMSLWKTFFEKLDELKSKILFHQEELTDVSEVCNEINALVADLRAALHHRIDLVKRFEQEQGEKKEFNAEKYYCHLLLTKMMIAMSDVFGDWNKEVVLQVVDIFKSSDIKIHEHLSAVLTVAAPFLCMMDSKELFQSPAYRFFIELFEHWNISMVAPPLKPVFQKLCTVWNNIPTPYEMKNENRGRAFENLSNGDEPMDVEEAGDEWELNGGPSQRQQREVRNDAGDDEQSMLVDEPVDVKPVIENINIDQNASGSQAVINLD